MIYLSVDGDNIGIILEKYFLESNAEGVASTSLLINQSINQVADVLVSLGWHIIYCAGDSLLGQSNLDTFDTHLLLESTRNIDLSFSIGIGKSVRDTYIALKYAKSSGKNIIVTFFNGEFTVIKK